MYEWGSEGVRKRECVRLRSAERVKTMKDERWEEAVERCDISTEATRSKPNDGGVLELN
jgi:hypothetical protein